MVSHELKTPLVPILGYVQMLQKEKFLGELNEKQKEAVDEIYSSTIKLERLIGDILTTQKLDLGKLEFHEEKINISKLLDELINEFKPSAITKKIELIKKDDKNTHITTDKNRISQVFSNLIKNAMDFVPANTGIIAIGFNENKEDVEFFVEDNGPGISAENQKEIFKKFYQIDTSTSRKRNGSGLGLTICKGIIERLGGKIWVNSIENTKTVFYFKIPKRSMNISINSDQTQKIQKII